MTAISFSCPVCQAVYLAKAFVETTQNRDYAEDDLPRMVRDYAEDDLLRIVDAVERQHAVERSRGFDAPSSTVSVLTQLLTETLAECFAIDHVSRLGTVNNVELDTDWANLRARARALFNASRSQPPHV